jgi:hypothetical protein
MRTIALLGLLFLAACAPNYSWVKQDNTDPHSDSIACQVELGSQPYGVLDEASWFDNRQQRFNECMKRRGWSPQ